MDIRKIKKLIDLVKDQNIGEIEIHEGEESVRISQATNIESSAKTINLQSEEISNTNKSTPQQKTSLEDDGKHVIKSPMIGIFYTAPAPNADSFVSIGQNVKPGDVLCIVEAMKMFNQIESDRAGKVVNCLVENGLPVEYGQPLFVIEEKRD